MDDGYPTFYRKIVKIGRRLFAFVFVSWVIQSLFFVDLSLVDRVLGMIGMLVVLPVLAGTSYWFGLCFVGIAGRISLRWRSFGALGLFPAGFFSGSFLIMGLCEQWRTWSHLIESGKTMEFEFATATCLAFGAGCLAVFSKILDCEMYEGPEAQIENTPEADDQWNSGKRRKRDTKRFLPSILGGPTPFDAFLLTYTAVFWLAGAVVSLIIVLTLPLSLWPIDQPGSMEYAWYGLGAVVVGLSITLASVAAHSVSNIPEKNSEDDAANRQESTHISP